MFWQRLSAFNEKIPNRLKSVLLFILMWWFLSLFMSANVLPGPVSTVKAFLRNDSGDVFFNVRMTMQRIGLGFFFAMVIGIIVGILMGVSRTLETWLDMWVMIVLSTPGLVFVILSFIWFGMNEFATIVAIAVASFPSIAINVFLAALVKFACSRLFSPKYIPILLPRPESVSESRGNSLLSLNCWAAATGWDISLITGFSCMKWIR
jgi:ABC-type nitrate/sulfonate/bicarbonate transport system permease component